MRPMSSTGKAIWKLDDPAAIKAEQQERAKQAAEMARKKLENALGMKVGPRFRRCA